MTAATALKLGQIGGALLLIVGVTSCTIEPPGYPLLFVAGAALYGGCRLAAWLRSKNP